MLQEKVGRYYSEKIEMYGPTARGVDWNSSESQVLRFEQLMKICEGKKTFSINDYGCGYGALIEYMVNCGYDFKYYGFDISEKMIDKAKGLYGKLDNCEFFTDESLLAVSDYSVASGIFNVKMRTDDKDWLEYILYMLERISTVSEKGFAFNVLTIYSDKERMRSDLYYADPCFLFDYCKTGFSKYVALLHDYGLYEFTILVRK
jgi:SAM-dependent methyltransferase